MTYPIKAHTMPLLEQILGTEDLPDKLNTLHKELDDWNRTHQDGPETDGKKHEKLHEYLVSTGANQALYNLIYNTLGTSDCADYTKNIPTDAAIKAYIDGCRAAVKVDEKKWNFVDFQSNPGYLICGNDTTHDERIIINFKNQTDALAFATELKDYVDSKVTFKILLGNHRYAIEKNDKIVIYFPKTQRDHILQLVNAIPAAQLAPQISGFYMQVKPGVGLAAETDPNWSFTMFTAEYCMKYLINHSPTGKEEGTPATAAGMYDYVMKRLTKPEHPRLPMDLYAAE